VGPGDGLMGGAEGRRPAGIGGPRRPAGGARAAGLALALAATAAPPGAASATGGASTAWPLPSGEAVAPAASSLPDRTGDSLRVHADPGLEQVARELAGDRWAREPLPAIGSPFACGPVELWVVRDLDRVPGLPPGATTEEWVAGLARLAERRIAVRAGGEAPGRLDALRRTLRHELAHVALHCATGGGAPRWLHEGYAQLASGEFEAGEAWRLRWILLRDGGDLLERLSLDFPSRAPEARVAYLLTYTAVQQLHRLSGERGLRALFDRLRAGDDMDAAMRHTYGLTLDRFEERWREDVADRYGWLYLLSRATVFWVFLTVALLALGWRRWRYERRRLEEMKREERMEEARAERAGWPVGGDVDDGASRLYRGSAFGERDVEEGERG